jgi:single-stranded-DNA-specific exonuclease
LTIQAFKEFIKEKASKFNPESIRIVSHLDSDGISAAALLVKLCQLKGIQHTLSIVPQLDENKLIELSKEKDDFFVFADIGSGQISLINHLMKDKQVLILDHHSPEKVQPDPHLTHINPHNFNINGSQDISGSGVVYLFCRAIHEGIKEFAYVAIIGAIGDVQEVSGFSSLNQEILQDALNSKKIRTQKGLKIFGLQTRPLYKLLEYSSDINLPGISGSKSGAIQFLQEIGIDPKNGSKWRKFNDLTGEEISTLITNLILKRKNEPNPEDILGNRYLLMDEKHDSPFHDLKEFSTILNGCGRLQRPTLGIGALLDEPNAKRHALKALAEYKSEIVQFMNWFREERGKKILEENNYVIINGQNKVPSTMIGTMSSIISKSQLVKKEIFILGLARQEDKTKVSLRVSSNDDKINLREILQTITKEIGGEAGGHKFAAGAIIPTDKEQEFINKAKKILKKII